MRAQGVIASQEADKKLGALVNALLFLGALWFAADRCHGEGFAVVLGLGVVYFLWMVVRDQRDPKADRRLIVMQAEHLNRLQMITEAHAAGHKVWFVKEAAYERDKREVHVFDDDRWDGSWRRIHGYALELERMYPQGRQKRLLETAKLAREPLEAGESVAKLEQAELTLWARGFLHMLKQAR